MTTQSDLVKHELDQLVYILNTCRFFDRKTTVLYVTCFVLNVLEKSCNLPEEYVSLRRDLLVAIQHVSNL